MLPELAQPLGVGIGAGLGIVALWASRTVLPNILKRNGDTCRENHPGMSKQELEDFCLKQHAIYRREIISDLKEAFGASMEKFRLDMESVFDRIQDRLAAGDTAMALLKQEQERHGDDIRGLKNRLERTYGSAHMIADRQGPG